MSLDYVICIAGATGRLARDSLLSLPGFSESTTESHRNGKTTRSLNGPHSVTWLHDVDSDESAVREWAGHQIEADVEILLEADKFADPLERRIEVASVVSILLARTQGDVMFYFTQGDEVLLLRRGGDIWVDNSADNFWLVDRKVLDLVKLPYKLSSLACVP